MDHKTLSGILDGRTWADLETIAKLEYALGEMLWMSVLPAAPVEGIRYKCAAQPRSCARAASSGVRS